MFFHILTFLSIMAYIYTKFPIFKLLSILFHHIFLLIIQLLA